MIRGPSPSSRLRMTVLTLLAVAPAAFGATIPSALTGRILSEGKPVRGATVTATSNVLQEPRVSRTGSYGTYWLAALPPGVYEVTFSAKGKQTITRRATIELGRVSRADAVLEPSEDEETVTSTAKTVSVEDTTAVTTHFSDWLLDRMPVPRDLFLPENIASGPPFYVTSLDGSIEIEPYTFFGEEVIEQDTLIRAAAPVDHEMSLGQIFVTRTRSGSNEFSFSLRDNIPTEDGVEHHFEGTAGGRIVRDRLWFFGAGWSDGWLGKLSAQLGTAHNLTGLWTDARNILALQYTGSLSPRLTAEATASRAKQSLRLDRDQLFAKVTYVLPAATGDHVLTAGGATEKNAVFVNDRWSYGRWIVDAGVRKQTIDHFDNTLPRVAVVYDLLGNGRHAIHATFTRYAPPQTGVYTESTAGYVSALGSSGAFRIDAIHTSTDSYDRLRFEADAAYRLFDRLEAGGNATYFAYDEISYYLSRLTANGWLTVEVPIGSQALSVTLLERYRADYDDASGSNYSTDLALRYRLPLGPTALTLAGDLTNVFNDTTPNKQTPRSLRLWVRLRL